MLTFLYFCYQMQGRVLTFKREVAIIWNGIFCASRMGIGKIGTLKKYIYENGLSISIIYRLLIHSGIQDNTSTGKVGIII